MGLGTEGCERTARALRELSLTATGTDRIRTSNSRTPALRFQGRSKSQSARAVAGRQSKPSMCQAQGLQLVRFRPEEVAVTAHKPVPPPANLGPAGKHLWGRMPRFYSFLRNEPPASSNRCAAHDKVALLAQPEAAHDVVVEVSHAQHLLSAVLPPMPAALLADARMTGVNQLRDAPPQRIEAAT